VERKEEPKFRVLKLRQNKKKKKKKKKNIPLEREEGGRIGSRENRIRLSRRTWAWASFSATS
jgi:hypothetical protein